MSKLGILIPMYKESFDVVKPLLDSLAIQQNVDFKNVHVIICNDGAAKEDSQYDISKAIKKQKYPFKVEYHLEDHSGVSATRNKCLDYSKDDYVMWCDCDDMFSSVCGLWIIFQEMDANGGFDGLISIFMEEAREPKTKRVLYVNHQMDSTFVHGKVYKRQYLIDKNLRFNPSLTIHEDSYFNILAQNCGGVIKYSQNPFYLWKWRDDSVCRHDEKYMLKTYRNMIDSNSALVQQFLDRGLNDKAIYYCSLLVLDAYYLMNKKEWLDQENKEYRDDTEKYFAKYYKEHKDLWEKCDLNTKMQISNAVRQKTVMQGMQMENMTLNDWLNHIETLL